MRARMSRVGRGNAKRSSTVAQPNDYSQLENKIYSQYSLCNCVIRERYGRTPFLTVSKFLIKLKTQKLKLIRFLEVVVKGRFQDHCIQSRKKFFLSFHIL